MKRVRFLVLFICVSVVAALSAVSAASGNTGASVVRGTQTPVTSGPCFSDTALGSYTMTGGLIGCWYTDTLVLEGLQPSGTVQLSGTEHFAGCLDVDGDGTCSAGDPAGTFSTTFTFTGKGDELGNEIHGRCHHPIVSGTGGFANATGVINFTDDVTTGDSSFTGPVRV